MEALLEYYEPTAEFVHKMQKMSFSDFICDYCGPFEDNKKKCRNNYDNRMRGKNLTFYYMDHIINKQEKAIKDKSKKLEKKRKECAVLSRAIEKAALDKMDSKNLIV